jgi:hypothetical protein
VSRLKEDLACSNEKPQRNQLVMRFNGAESGIFELKAAAVAMGGLGFLIIHNVSSLTRVRLTMDL